MLYYEGINWFLEMPATGDVIEEFADTMWRTIVE